MGRRSLRHAERSRAGAKVTNCPKAGGRPRLQPLPVDSLTGRARRVESPGADRRRRLAVWGEVGRRGRGKRFSAFTSRASAREATEPQPLQKLARPDPGFPEGEPIATRRRVFASPAARGSAGTRSPAAACEGLRQRGASHRLGLHPRGGRG